MHGHPDARLTQRRMLHLAQVRHAVDLGHQRLHLRHIARLLQARLSIVARVLGRLSLWRLSNPEPVAPVQRYAWERPGDLIHIDVRFLARFRKEGHRITGNRQRGAPTGRRRQVHGAVDDATTLACVEVPADEQTSTVIGILRRVVAWFNGRASSAGG